MRIQLLDQSFDKEQKVRASNIIWCERHLLTMDSCGHQDQSRSSRFPAKTSVLGIDECNLRMISNARIRPGASAHRANMRGPGMTPESWTREKGQVENQ